VLLGALRMLSAYYRTLIGSPMLEDEAAGQRKWSDRRQIGRLRRFRNIRWVAAPRGARVELPRDTLLLLR